MPIRRSFHFNTSPSALKNDGFLMSLYSDIHGRGTDITKTSYWLDQNRGGGSPIDILEIGDKIGYKTNSVQSLPVSIVGGLGMPVTGLSTTPYIPTLDDSVLVFDTTAANITVNLPALSSVQPGKMLTIFKKVPANSVFINPYAGDTIDGFTTGYYLANTGESVSIIADQSTNTWRRYITPARGIYLNHEYGMSPTVTISSSSFQTVRSWSTVFLTAKDFMVVSNGSGWSDSTSVVVIEFVIFVDGNQGPVLGWLDTQQSEYHVNFKLSGLLSNQSPGLHTVTLSARRKISVGGTNWTMDSNDFLNFDLIQF